MRMCTPATVDGVALCCGCIPLLVTGRESYEKWRVLEELRGLRSTMDAMGKGLEVEGRARGEEALESERAGDAEPVGGVEFHVERHKTRPCLPVLVEDGCEGEHVMERPDLVAQATEVSADLPRSGKMCKRASQSGTTLGLPACLQISTPGRGYYVDENGETEIFFGDETLLEISEGTWGLRTLLGFADEDEKDEGSEAGGGGAEGKDSGEDGLRLTGIRLTI